MPTFGRTMLQHWLLDPEIVYLNHGTVGATPLRVLRKQQQLRDEIERQPASFILRELNLHNPAPWRTESRFREAIRVVAEFVGSRPEDLVFVPNVTTGINAVLRSLRLGPGDEILLTNLAYGAVALAAGVAAGERGVALRTVQMPHPVTSPGQVIDAIVSALTSRTRLLVVDHLAAQTALVMPVRAIAEACHARNIDVLVDGAHAPGSIALDIPALGADWYSANLHKWAHAPRACGILWSKLERQTPLRNPITSWGSGHGFHEEFEVIATSDPTPALAAPEGVALLREWGFPAVLGYMHGLAWEAAGVLTSRWGTTLETPREMVGAMVTVPLPERAGSTASDAERVRLGLLIEDRIEAPIHAAHGRLWVRVSAQVYNDRSDIDRLADAVARL